MDYTLLPGEFYAAMAFLWGALWGSFANVAIYRLPRGESLVRPGSHCPECGGQIRWYQNVPVLSYVLLGGRCAQCRKPISFRYPMVELLVAVLSLAVWQQAAMNPVADDFSGLVVFYLFEFFFALALVIVIFTDMETMLVPDAVSLPMTVLGLAAALLTQGPETPDWLESILGMVLGAGVVLLLRFVYRRWRQVEAIGLGDVKLMAMIGAFLGVRSLLFVFLAGSVQGLLYALILLMAGRKHRLPEGLFEEQEVAQHEGSFRGMRVPFGPFLSLAALEWLFFSGYLVAFAEGLFGG